MLLAIAVTPPNILHLLKTPTLSPDASSKVMHPLKVQFLKIRLLKLLLVKSY